MFKTLTVLVVAGLMLGLATDGFSQRSARGGKGEPRIMESSDGSFVRGWLNKKSGGKSEFTDMKGETTEITEDSKLHTLKDMQGQYQQYERSILGQELPDYEKYTKLMAWAKQHELYKEVAENAQRVIRLNPANPDVAATKELAWAKEQLAAVKAGPSAKNQNNWTMEDVQKVRFALLPTQGSIGNVQVSLKRKVQQRFLEEMASRGKYETPEARRQFLSRPVAEQVRIIKLETGNEFQPDIMINSNPPVMAEFQRSVQPILNRTCANASCHGSGTLALKLLPRATAAPEIYANFYSLDTYHGSRGDLIDHGKPENSALLRFLLPAGQGAGEQGHPQPITPPPARSTKDVRYQQVLKWIRDLPAEPIDAAVNEGGVTASQPAEGTPVDNATKGTKKK